MHCRSLLALVLALAAFPSLATPAPTISAAPSLRPTAPPAGPLSNGQMTLSTTIYSSTCPSFYVYFGGSTSCFAACNRYYSVGQSLSTMQVTPQSTGFGCSCVQWTGTVTGNVFTSNPTADGVFITMTSISGYVRLTMSGPAGIVCPLSYYVASGYILGLSASSFSSSSVYIWYWLWVLIVTGVIFLVLCIACCSTRSRVGGRYGRGNTINGPVGGAAPPVVIVQGQPMYGQPPIAIGVPVAQTVASNEGEVPIAQATAVTGTRKDLALQ